MDVFLLPGRPGPQRRLIEPRDAAAVIRVRISRTTSAARSAACRRQEWMNPGRDGSAGDVGDQVPAPLDGDVLEDDQVNRQGAQPRADGQGGVRHARRADGCMGPAAGAPRPVEVVLDPLRLRGRGSRPAESSRGPRPGQPPRQVTAAGAGPSG